MTQSTRIFCERVKRFRASSQVTKRLLLLTVRAAKLVLRTDIVEMLCNPEAKSPQANNPQAKMSYSH
jgi:hypothetical protein